MNALDEIDRRMIEILRHDGRISIPALADRLNVARATAYARFNRLLADGVIERFSAVVAPEALGLGVAAVVQVNVEQHAWRETRDELAGLPGVEWAGLATGPFDVVLLVRCEDLQQLRDVVLVRLHAIEGVTSAQTFVLLDEPVRGIGRAGSR